MAMATMLGHLKAELKRDNKEERRQEGCQCNQSWPHVSDAPRGAPTMHASPVHVDTSDLFVIF